MTNPQLEDHLVGLELQLVELVEGRNRAEVQGRTDDARQLEREIADLQAELAATAERVTEDEIVVEEPAHLDAPTAAESAAA